MLVLIGCEVFSSSQPTIDWEQAQLRVQNDWLKKIDKFLSKASTSFIFEPIILNSTRGINLLSYPCLMLAGVVLAIWSAQIGYS